MKKDKYPVHAAHCCELHGCKYNDKDCPVMEGKVKQLYLCESCSWDGITSWGIFNWVKTGQIRTCQHCGKVTP